VDAEAATHALARAGFAPTPISVQVNPDPDGGAPRLTGTSNVTAMFARGYIEVLFKTSDTPLAREFDAGLARHPGVHIVAFGVADAAAAHRRLAESGFRVRPLVEMQRAVDARGEPVTAAFTIARVEMGEMPRIDLPAFKATSLEAMAIAVCQTRSSSSSREAGTEAAARPIAN
jgi:hypothetical protein